MHFIVDRAEPKAATLSSSLLLFLVPFSFLRFGWPRSLTLFHVRFVGSQDRSQLMASWYHGKHPSFSTTPGMNFLFGPAPGGVEAFTTH